MAGDFLDVSLSDLLKGYVTLEQGKTEAELQRYRYETEIQGEALNNAQTDTFSESVGGGSYESSSYFDRVPKGLLYGSVALLGVGVGLMVFGK